MQYLYSGGCSNLEVASGDILELMAAASFFQLEGLLRYTELRCAGILDMDNVVTIYIHAKVRVSLSLYLNRKRKIFKKSIFYRFIVQHISWNIVKDFYCKIWLIY